MSLAQHLEESGSDLDDVYSNGRSWSDLRADAGLPQQAPGPEEQDLRRACGRLLHLDDMERIETYRRLPPSQDVATLRRAGPGYHSVRLVMDNGAPCLGNTGSVLGCNRPREASA